MTFQFISLTECLNECVGASRRRSEIAKPDSVNGTADFARDLASSISSSSHAAFGSRAQAHLVISRKGLAEVRKGGKQAVLGILGQHIIQPRCYRLWHRVKQCKVVSPRAHPDLN
jgi:hypothetical protein